LGTTKKKLFLWVGERPLGMMLSPIVMKTVLSLLQTFLMVRATLWSWALATTQSNPLKLNPVAQVLHEVAETQVEHLEGQGWHCLLASSNLPLPQVLLLETQRF